MHRGKNSSEENGLELQETERLSIGKIWRRIIPGKTKSKNKRPKYKKPCSIVWEWRFLSFSNEIEGVL